MKKMLAILVLITLSAMPSANAASVKGSQGQILSVSKTTAKSGAIWISSNPPAYAVGLTQEFLPGGRFTQKVKVSKKIGKFDCTKVKCAITVRADHLRSNDRTSDLFIPIIIK
ncbi:MAG: hypothetical protein EBX11_03910 [Actinobacteria bacterium]|nr:hypothetical protein [Actinomycetota bacterium]